MGQTVGAAPGSRELVAGNHHAGSGRGIEIDVGPSQYQVFRLHDGETLPRKLVGCFYER